MKGLARLGKKAPCTHFLRTELATVTLILARRRFPLSSQSTEDSAKKQVKEDINICVSRTWANEGIMQPQPQFAWRSFLQQQAAGARLQSQRQSPLTPQVTPPRSAATTRKNAVLSGRRKHRKRHWGEKSQVERGGGSIACRAKRRKHLKQREEEKHCKRRKEEASQGERA